MTVYCMAPPSSNHLDLTYLFIYRQFLPLKVFVQNRCLKDVAKLSNQSGKFLRCILYKQRENNKDNKFLIDLSSILCSNVPKYQGIMVKDFLQHKVGSRFWKFYCMCYLSFSSNFNAFYCYLQSRVCHWLNHCYHLWRRWLFLYLTLWFMLFYFLGKF